MGFQLTISNRARSNKEIKDFCETNFNIDFPMTEKIDVIGNKAHPSINGQKIIMAIALFQMDPTRLLLVRMVKF